LYEVCNIFWPICALIKVFNVMYWHTTQEENMESMFKTLCKLCS
jgi:hypothetical protein